MRYIDARFLRSGEDEVVVGITDVTNRVDREREIVNSVERERNIIGHDLHDGLGQLLTGYQVVAGAAARAIGGEATVGCRPGGGVSVKCFCPVPLAGISGTTGNTASSDKTVATGAARTRIPAARGATVRGADVSS